MISWIVPGFRLIKVARPCHETVLLPHHGGTKANRSFRSLEEFRVGHVSSL